MAIKPSPTIAGKLRKLFSNNKQTIEPAIGDSIPGGSGGGANVLTLYLGEKNGAPWAYKNEEHTEEYATAEEARNAVQNADIIKCVTEFNVIFADQYIAGNSVYVYIIDVNPESEALEMLSYALFQRERGRH